MTFFDFVDKHPIFTFFMTFMVLVGINSIVTSWRMYK